MVQIDKKAPESPSKSVRIKDFSGGLNTTISGSLLNINEAQKSKNVSVEQKGTIVPRKGRRRRYDTPYSAQPCSGMGMLFKQDATSFLVMSSGDSIYSDAPRMSYRYDTTEDFEKGTKGAYADYERTPGSIKVKAGTLRTLFDGIELNGFSQFTSVANTTYGTKFSVNRAMKMFKCKFIPAVAGSEYTITLWEDWLEPGATSREKVFEFMYTATSDKINVEYVKEFYSNDYKLEPDRDYMLTIHNASANAVTRFLKAAEVLPSYMTLKGSASVVGKAYPTTDTSVTASMYGAAILMEYLDHEITVDSEALFASDGVLTDLSYEDVDVKDLTHATGQIDASTLTNRLDRIQFSDFSIDTGVFNFEKTTQAKSLNKLSSLYPYAENKKTTDFPVGAAWASGAELTDAEYAAIKADGTATSFSTGATAAQYSVLKLSYFVPVEVYDHEKITSLLFTLSIAPIDATTKLKIYALPAGGTEIGATNNQVLLATYDPNVFRPYILQITADPKRFVDPATGKINLYIVPDTINKGFSISAFKMSDTFVRKTDAALKDVLSMAYTVDYANGEYVSTKTLTYKEAHFDITMFDKA